MIEPSSVVLAVTITGTASASDSRAAVYFVKQANVNLAAQEPPGTPLPAANATQYRASYAILLGQGVTKLHNENLVTSAVSPPLTDTEFKDIKKAVTDSLNAGRTPATIIAAIAAA